MPYDIKLPDKLLYWWATKMPLKISKMGMVLLATADNLISFTTNIKLLFVPMFGLSSLTGRFVSFVTRTFMVFVGIIFMLFALVACILAPFVWLTVPFFIFKFSSIWYAILYFVILYLIFVFKNLNIPNKRISQVSAQKDRLKCFRPRVKAILTDNSIDNLLQRFFEESSVLYLMKKAELTDRTLFDKLINTPYPTQKDLVDEGIKKARENGARYVEMEHVFISLVENLPNIGTTLSVFDSNFGFIKETAYWIVKERERLSKVYFWQEDYVMPSFGGIGKGMLGRVTPNLDSMSTDITKQVKAGGIEDIVGREEEIKKIAEILDGDKNDILIVGESGVGKTSIIEGVAYKIMTGTEHKTLKNKRVVRLEIGSLVSEGRDSGNVAEKLSTVLKEVEASGDIILFIDEMQNIVTGMGEQGGSDSTILSILENHISKNRIRLIGAISMSNYRKYVEPNEAVARLFQIIKINETSKEDTIRILKSRAEKMEKRHGIIITYPALVASIDLSEKLIGNRVLPDKAVDLLERTSTEVKNSTRYLTTDSISEEISKMTDIPVTAIDRNEAEKLLSIGDLMKERVIGQDHAIEKIKAALQRARTRMRDEKRPMAGFLFVGMTGVGKTETAKALSESYFGGEDNMIRLDMSEYQQVDSLNRIIGSPDGSTMGTLTEKVRNKPFCLVLIDEIEKAHPNIILTFLQMLDEGRLTDTAGNEADFTNTIIIATSNVGTKAIQAVFESGQGYEEIQKSAMLEVRNKFAPELLNRFTAIVVFNPLSKENLREITKLMLGRVKKVAEEEGIQINFKPDLIEKLIEKGYSPEWGARPMARVIEDTVESYIALKLLKKEINPGDRIMLGTEVFSI